MNFLLNFVRGIDRYLWQEIHDYFKISSLQNTNFFANFNFLSHFQLFLKKYVLVRNIFSVFLPPKQAYLSFLHATIFTKTKSFCLHKFSKFTYFITNILSSINIWALTLIILIQSKQMKLKQWKSEKNISFISAIPANLSPLINSGAKRRKFLGPSEK